MRFCILLVVGLSGCSDEHKGEDTPPTDEKKEANANIACSTYSYYVCERGLLPRCQVQMEATWGTWTEDNEEGLEKWSGWVDDCEATVQVACVDYVLAAPDFDDIRYIVDGVCYQGYSAAHAEEWNDATCEDWVEDTDSFVVSYPYVDYCPCLDSGEWHVEGPDSTAECGAGHDPV